MDVFGGAPRFLAYPRTFTVPNGADAVLKCQIAGDPRPTVIWERDKAQITLSARHRFLEEGDVYHLVVSRARLEDSGQYICKAKNGVGETYAAATLRVEEGEGSPEDKPAFLVKPASARVAQGDGVVFDGQLTGCPAPAVTWEKDGRKLGEIFESAHFSAGQGDGEGWHRLEIFGARAPDAGVYLCRARNVYGEAMAAAVLLVDPGPRPDDDGTAPSPVSAVAVPAGQPSANGLRDGEGPGGHGRRRERRHRSRHHHHRRPPEPEPDPGKARRRAEAGDSPRPAKVKVFSVTEGKHAKFRCYVTGKPKPEIVWRKDGRLVAPGRRHLLYEDREGYFILKLLYCKQLDNGLYACAASNAAGHTLSSVLLNVKEPHVKFTSQLQDVEVNEREQAILECEVPGDSVPAVWYLEDRKLLPSAKYVIEQRGALRRLTIKDITMDDDGIYLCEMKDGGRSIAEVAVKGKIVKRLPRKLDVAEGENAAFCVDLDEENVEVRWYKDGEPLHESHKTIIKSFGKTHILVFVNAAEDDSGVVSFVITDSKSSCQLRVKPQRQTAPGAPVGAQMSGETPNAALLLWAPPSDCRRSGVTGYVIERQVLGSEGWVRCLTTERTAAVEILGESVPAEAQYRFRVCSVNNYGRSGATEFPGAVHLVPVARIHTHLSDMIVCEGTDAEFTVDLSSSVLGTWHMKGRQLLEGERVKIEHLQTRHSLLIRGVKVEDNEAEITFVAHGVRDSAILFVKAAPVTIAMSPGMDRVLRIAVSDSIILCCELSRSDGQIRWCKDGEELAASDRVTMQSFGPIRRLIVQSAQPADSGQYSCDAGDDVIAFNVNVLDSPVRIVNCADDTKVEYLCAERIALTCELSRPNAQVKWYKNGLEVEGSANVTMESLGVHRSLIVQSAGTEDSGEYVCDAGDDSIFYDITVREPPTMIRATEVGPRTEYLSGEPIVLWCETSRAEAEVKWYKDGQELEGTQGVRLEAEGGLRRLVIDSASGGDSGDYTCEVPDDCVCFTVAVSDPPVRITSSSPAALSVVTGDEVVLWCELSVPEAEVRWSKDGVEMEPGERATMEVDGERRRLTIHAAGPEDRGTYVCDTPDDSAQFEVTVSDPPVRITSSSPAALSVVTGDEVVLWCELSVPEAEVRWSKDGVEVDPGERATMEVDGERRRLTIHAAGPEDRGTYVCDTPDDSAQFEVTVSDPPVRITSSSPVVLSVVTGDEVVLWCELSVPEAKVRWSKDGVEVEPGERAAMEVDGERRRLTVHAAGPEDRGTYVCDTPDDSAQFEVTVSDPPVRITSSSPAALSVVTGDEVVLWCELSVPEAEVRWSKEGVEVEQGERATMEVDGERRRLTIHTAGPEDRGTYVCDTPDDSVQFEVTVSDPPVTIVGNSRIAEERCFTETEVIAMTCELSRPDVDVQWFRDGTELLPSDKIRIEARGLTRELMIFDSEPLDSGQYVCHAGSDTLTFKVTVAEAPVLFTNKEKHPEEISANENGKAVLAAIVSKENVTVAWYRHKELVVEGEKHELRNESRVHSLIVKNVRKEDSGLYNCRSADDEMFFNVNVEELPLLFVLRLEDLCVQKGGSVTLWCELNKAKGDVMWLKDGCEVQPSHKQVVRADGRLRSLTLAKAALQDEGEYCCESKDDRTAARVSVRVPRVVEFISDLHGVTVLEGEDAKFKCMVSPEDVGMAWRVGGAEVPPGSDKYLVSRNGLCHTLVIRRCKLAEAARVTAEAEGMFSSASLQVQEAQIVFTRKMTSAVSEELQDATFEVEVSCESAEVQWMKQGVVIQPGPKFLLQREGRTRRLTVHGTVSADRGNYRCETLHDKTQAKLIVEPRRISVRKALVDLETFEREAVTFQVELSHPEIEGVWIKDGIRVKPNTNRRISTAGRVHSLTLSALTLEDTGTIAFQSDSVRCTSRLTVREPPVTFLKTLKDLRVPETTIVTLECELSRPNVEVVWYKDDLEMKPNKNIRIYSMGRKRIVQLGKCRLQESGTYICDAGESKSSSKLEVYEREIQIVQQLEDQEVRENDNAVFVCEVSHEEVKSEWFQNGDRIKSNSTVKIRQEGTKHFLLICNVMAEDAGEIRFTAKNVESAAHLDVNELPIKIVKPLRDKTALEKHKVILECKVSNPRAGVRWYRGDEELGSTGKYRISSEGCYRQLVIHDVSSQDEDTYTCDAFDDSTSAKVLVEAN
uniref:obscurin-like protein 1a isoform X2 n=1 Tax=Pristiophorus japonicus TaxID=55135 RepID=UPI00398F0F38